MEYMADGATLLQYIGAFGIGSAATQYLLSGRERREVRAHFLAVLSRCEQARWYPLDDGQPTFWRLRHELVAAALVARLPKDAIRVYLLVGLACSWLSEADFEGTWDPDGGGIAPEAARAGEAAATLVSDLAWAPWKYRWFRARRIGKIKSLAVAVGPEWIDWNRAL